MGGFDDHVGIIGDWMPPSPSPRSFFLGMLGDDPGSRPPKDDNHTTGFTFPGPDRPIRSENGDGVRAAADEPTKPGAFGEPKMGSRAGLVERMAARAGYNAPRLNTDIVRPSADQETQLSPYLTIPPGLSPTTLLDSPVFLSNSLVQPSPTTGKFQFAPNGNGNGDGNGRSSMMFSDSSSKNKDSLYEDFNGSSFAFKPPAPDPAPISHHPANPPFMSWQSFPSVDVSENPFPPQNMEPVKVQSQNWTSFSDFSFASAENKAQIGTFQAANGNVAAERSADEEADQSANINSAPSDDGYNWRKYGQKQVKGSEFPRSYYKCTHPNCTVKKKVERSHEGHITEIIYKGAHNHPKPPPNRRSGVGSSTALSDMDEQGLADPGHDGNLELTSSAMVQGSGQFESSDAVDGSTTFSNEEEEDDRATHGSVSLGYDGEGDESESKRRKVEAYAADVSGATRAVREPRVVVQTTSEVDILDDGYRWRKYGQKVVKGNPNPRSYYKCTSAGCTVRKHVERASHDLKSVITTYEGKHNHDVPAARNTGHMATQAQSVQPQVHRPEPSQIQTNMARFERAHFGFHGQPQQQMGPTHGTYGYGMNLVGAGGLGHMAMAGLGPNQRSALPAQYLGQVQARQPNDFGMMVPKGEPKVELGSDPGANGSSIYHHQIMNRLPLGPQM